VCAAIDRATAQTYRLVRADIGALLRIRVTATNAVGSTSTDSGPTSVVGSRGSQPRVFLSVKGPSASFAPTGAGQGAFGSSRLRHRFSFRFGPSAARVTFLSRHSALRMRSLKITRIRVTGSRVLVQGRGKLGRRMVWFSATAVDRGQGRRDYFRIKLSNGYSAAGRLVAGSITIR
jgi:hypothetical protein